MIEDGITEGKYIETSDNTVCSLMVTFINTKIMK